MKPKRLPRLWCALQGLLPLEVKDGLMLGRVAARVEPVDKREPRAEKISAAGPALPAVKIARLSEG